MRKGDRTGEKVIEQEERRQNRIEGERTGGKETEQERR